MAYKIYQSNDSIRDYYGILEYLTENLFAPGAAVRFHNELESCYTRLKEHPFIYAVCRNEDLAAKGFRLATVMRYIVFYKVDEQDKIVRIHRILHGTMDYTQQQLD